MYYKATYLLNFVDKEKHELLQQILFVMNCAHYVNRWGLLSLISLKGADKQNLAYLIASRLYTMTKCHWNLNGSDWELHFYVLFWHEMAHKWKGVRIPSFIQTFSNIYYIHHKNMADWTTMRISYTGCFTTLGHNCRRWFPRSLWSKISYKHVSDFGRLRSYGSFSSPIHALVWTASNSWKHEMHCSLALWMPLMS